MDSVVTVGLKRPGQRRGVDERGRALMSEGEWNSIARRFEAWDIEIVYMDEVQPVAEVRVANERHIERLRRSPHVSYVEPGGEPTENLLQTSCGSSAVKHPGSVIPPYADMVPYTLVRHDVPLAWKRSTGRGKSVGIIDSGVSYDQDQFRTGGVAPAFDAGASSGRTLTLISENEDTTYPGAPWHDTCGHGTKAASVLFAPFDGHNIVGVAYGSDGVVVRALGGVTFGMSQFRAVRRSIDEAGERADIVSMSIGSVYHYDSIADRIRYWYNRDSNPLDKEVLFIGASGTSPGRVLSDGVIFPSSLDEVVAVTGLDPDHLDVMKACDNCWRGSEVEFASYISGDASYRGGSYPEMDAIGGSSAAAPIVAGIAALVWSRYPNWSREQVLDRLRESAALWENRDDRIGYGPIDANQAVGGMHGTGIIGTRSVTSAGTYTYTASVRGDGPFSYQWNSGESTPSIDRNIQITSKEQIPTVRNEPVSVSITDNVTGETKTVAINVLVCSPGACTGGDPDPPVDPEPPCGSGPCI